MATKTPVLQVKGPAALSVFVWQGKDKRGVVLKGEMSAKNQNMVSAELRRQGIESDRVKPKPKPLFGKAGKSITSRDIALISRQMATMMQSGVPIVQAIEIIAAGQKNPRLATLLDSLRNDLSSGLSLAESMGKHPVQFDDLFRNLVHAGEGAGVLDTVLDTVASYKEKTETLKGKIKKAMFYPIAVIIVAMIVSAILLLYVVPQFESLFKGFGADLPAFTQMIVNASKFLQSYWWLILAAAAGSVYGFLAAFKRSARLRHTCDKILLRTPIIGKIMHGSALSRFALTLALTFRAGVPMVEALETVAGATGSETYRVAVMRVREDVAAGYQVNMAMKQTGLFPHMMVQMTAIGEEAGALDTMLEKVGAYYEEEVNNQVDALTSLLEPLIMVVLGTLVGGMVIGMYLPIFKMAEVVGG